MTNSHTPRKLTATDLTPGTPVWVALYAGGAFIKGTVKWAWPLADMVEVDHLEGLTGYVTVPLGRITLRSPDGP